MRYEPPTFCTEGDVLSRAEREAERERDMEFIDDLERAENEADDFILCLDELAKQSGELADAAKLVRQAKAMVMKRRHIMECAR